MITITGLEKHLAIALLIALLLPAYSSSQQSPAGFDDVVRQAEAARQQGNIGDAITLYAQAVQIDPSWQDGWWYLGSLQYGTGAYEAARDALTRFIALNPSAGPATAMRGLCEYETGEYQKALQDIEHGLSLGAANQRRNEDILRYHEALLLGRLGKFEDAMQVYAMFVPKNSEPTPEYMLALGLSALHMPLLPNEVPADQRDLVLKTGQAVLHFMSGQREMAKQQFEELFRQFPSSPNLHYACGFLLYPIDLDEAAAQFRQEMAISPSNTADAVMLAWTLLMQEDPSEALPIAEKAVSADPSLPSAQLALGRAQVQLGQTEEGMTHLEKTLQLEPENLEARLALVKAYSRLGRKQDARRERLLCIQMASANPRQLAHP